MTPIKLRHGGILIALQLSLVGRCVDSFALSSRPASERRSGIATTTVSSATFRKERNAPILLRNGIAPSFSTVAARSNARGRSSSRLPLGFTISPSDGEPSFIDEAATFMVDSFWLRSPQNLVTGSAAEGGGDALSDAAKSTLVRDQADDFTTNYGERMGKRLLESTLIAARNDDSSTMMALVGIEARLFDSGRKVILGLDQSETMVKNAVASLGPKQRRQYKDRPVRDIVRELTPPELSLVCVLGNLAVSPAARRKGLGAKLCAEAERIAKEEWGFESMYLKVEAGNDAARGLYEGKLGYELQFTDESATGIRVDAEKGEFCEVPTATLILAKKL